MQPLSMEMCITLCITNYFQPKMTVLQGLLEVLWNNLWIQYVCTGTAESGRQAGYAAPFIGQKICTNNKNSSSKISKIRYTAPDVCNVLHGDHDHVNIFSYETPNDLSVSQYIYYISIIMQTRQSRHVFSKGPECPVLASYQMWFCQKLLKNAKYNS